MTCLRHLHPFTSQSSATTTTLFQAQALVLLIILSIDLVHKSDCPKKR